jgi:hypothetical protein
MNIVGGAAERKSYLAPVPIAEALGLLAFSIAMPKPPN